MLATGVYSVIKKKEGVVESLSLSLTFEKKNILTSLGWSCTVMQDLPKQRDLFVQ